MKTNLIFAFGDSSTWGAFDLEKGGWAERLKNYFFQKREDTFVYNLGIESNTTKDLLKRFENELRARIYSEDSSDYDYGSMIIFEIGQNDSLYNKDFGKAWVKLEEFEKNVYELIDKAKKYTDKIIFLELPEVDESKTIPWEENGDSYSNENILRYNEKIKGICKKEKVIFLPTRDILKIAED